MPSNKITVHVPDRFGQRTNHHRRLTQLCGTLVPIYCKEVLPNTEISQKLSIAVTMPPLTSDTYMRVQYKVEAFAIPLRLCFAGFENWFTAKASNVFENPDYSPNKDYLPYISMPILQDGDDEDDKLHIPFVFSESVSSGMVRFDREVDDRGTLLNYFGISRGEEDISINRGAYPLNPGKMLAYHLVWQHWYRAPLVQSECFGVVDSNSFGDPSGLFWAGILPFQHYFVQTVAVASMANKDNFLLADGCSLFQLRQRNYGFDYFTQAYPTASQPNMEVTVANGKFSISELRASNSLQQWLEMSQIAGNRLVDVCKVRYGANLKDGVAQRPILLGSATYDVFTSGVTVTAQNDVLLEPTNPFSNQAGGRVGNAFGSGSDFIIDHFTAQEPMYIMVIGSLVPKATYGSGVPKDMMRYTKAGFGPSDLADYPSYMLQNTGNEPIYKYELSYRAAVNRNSIFGYTEKYADWFYDRSDAVGEFSSAGSLHSFVLQRIFDSTPEVNSAFLEISPFDMDDITIVNAALSSYGCWVDIDFDTRYLWPLYPNSMPSLQNPAYEHGRPISVHRGGFRF